jgi:hypothetical protein
LNLFKNGEQLDP